MAMPHTGLGGEKGTPRPPGSPAVHLLGELKNCSASFHKLLTTASSPGGPRRENNHLSSLLRLK